MEAVLRHARDGTAHSIHQHNCFPTDFSFPTEWSFPNGSTTTAGETPNYIFLSLGRERWRGFGVWRLTIVFFALGTRIPNDLLIAGPSAGSAAHLARHWICLFSVMKPEASANRNSCEKEMGGKKA